MSDKLADRQRLIGMGQISLADYALSLEQQIEELKHAPECPYPLHRAVFGHPKHANHRAYIGELPTEEGQSPLLIVRCEACGHVTFEDNVAIA
jgi:hypothetical protein